MGRFRPAVVALVTAACGLVAVSPTLAAKARFSASLKGTYTERGTLTDTGCYRVDENENPTYFTGSGTSSEDDVFASRRPVIVLAERNPARGDFDAGSLDAVKTAFTVQRTSTLVIDSSEPSGCHPNDQIGAPRPDCGTKHLTYGVRLIGRRQRLYSGPAFFVYELSRGHVTPYFPDDPFSGCFLVHGDVWPGKLESGHASVSLSKLFNRGVRKVVVHGSTSGGTHRHEADGPGQLVVSGTYRLSWTLTLRRRG
jgi:hypothetical protein